MRRSVVMLIVALGACSASTKSASTIEPTMTVQTDDSNVKCPPKIAPASNCEPATQTPQSDPAKERVVIPGAPGFWCSDFRSAPDDPEYLSACYRIEDTCKNARQHANNSGAIATECEAIDKAHCFVMANTAEQAIFWRCYTTEQHCLGGHERLQVKHAKLQFSNCSLTARSHDVTKANELPQLRSSGMNTHTAKRTSAHQPDHCNKIRLLDDRAAYAVLL